MVRLEDAVDGDHLALHDQQPVASEDLPDGDRRQLAPLVAVRGAWRPLDQGLQLPGGPPGGVRLQRAPARQHQRDHGARQVLAQQHRARHRQQGDHVDAQLTPAQPRQEGSEQGDDPERGGQRPRQRRRTRQAEQAQDPAHRQAEHRRGQQRPGGESARRPPASRGTVTTRERFRDLFSFASWDRRSARRFGSAPGHSGEGCSARGRGLGGDRAPDQDLQHALVVGV